MTANRDKGAGALVSETDHQRIAARIRQAEQQTSGEIFAVVARASDDYFHVTALLSAIWSMMIGLALAIVTYWAGSNLSSIMLMGMVIASFLLFLGLFHLFPGARLIFVPRSIGYRRASSNAVRQFLAHGIHNTSDRSGVLLFVSIAERYAEVVADAGINEWVPQNEWNDMVATLTDHAARGELADGFIEAIDQAGALLKKHFPRSDDSQNELQDKLIEL